MSSKKHKAYKANPEIAIDAGTPRTHNEGDTDALEKAAEEIPADVPKSDNVIPEDSTPGAGGCYRIEDGKRVKTQD